MITAPRAISAGVRSGALYSSKFGSAVPTVPWPVPVGSPITSAVAITGVNRLAASPAASQGAVRLFILLPGHALEGRCVPVDGPAAFLKTTDALVTLSRSENYPICVQILCHLKGRESHRLEDLIEVSSSQPDTEGPTAAPHPGPTESHVGAFYRA